MPLLVFNLVQGRSEPEVRNIADVAHEVLVRTFKVHPRDRYQIINQRPMAHLIAEDTGLGFNRSANLLILQMFSRPRSVTEKTEFYKQMSDDLALYCKIEPTDLIISIVQNSDEDWSFGRGEAQFLTGAL
ncbi:tautomerase family protein [Acidisoma cellulosilytica]|uniref:Tautomerase family protein n=1 Tax=Acidisoma cellulosilyticum TaxID=2802395 RepID=A0A963Z754_9PROT|nr:tautomerase family protein [Acidisoma cellulosilyticum]MCB8883821.1 tautomerase family protein [Acidisoma cellulosilyticum]